MIFNPFFLFIFNLYVVNKAPWAIIDKRYRNKEILIFIAIVIIIIRIIIVIILIIIIIN